jgi:hypothetical protein
VFFKLLICSNIVEAGALITTDRSKCDFGERNADTMMISAMRLTADIPRTFSALVIIIIMVLMESTNIGKNKAF